MDLRPIIGRACQGGCLLERCFAWSRVHRNGIRSMEQNHATLLTNWVSENGIRVRARVCHRLRAAILRSVYHCFFSTGSLTKSQGQARTDESRYQPFFVDKLNYLFPLINWITLNKNWHAILLLLRTTMIDSERVQWSRNVLPKENIYSFRSARLSLYLFLFFSQYSSSPSED